MEIDFRMWAIKKICIDFIDGDKFAATRGNISCLLSLQLCKTTDPYDRESNLPELTSKTLLYLKS